MTGLGRRCLFPSSVQREIVAIAIALQILFQWGVLGFLDGLSPLALLKRPNIRCLLSPKQVKTNKLIPQASKPQSIFKNKYKYSLLKVLYFDGPRSCFLFFS